MAMPAFDTEPASAPPSPSGDAPVGKPASAETAPASAKPPPASLISIAVKGKPAAAKAGDLTRFFELSRRQGAAPFETPSVEPPPAEPAPAMASPAEMEPETAPDPLPVAPAPIEAPAVDMSPEPFEAPPEEIAAAPAPPAVEPPSFVEASPVPEARLEPPELSSETILPLMLAPPSVEGWDAAVSPPVEAAVTEAPPTLVAAVWTIDAPSPVDPPPAAESAPAPEAPETLALELAPAEEAPADLEIPAPAWADIEPPAPPAPAAAMEADASAEPEPPRLVEPPPPVAAAPTPVLAPARPAVPEFADLADYWRSLRPAADHPAAEAIDRDLVTARWPGSLLIGYTPASQDPRDEPRPARVTRLGTACAETQSAVDAGSYATEWMLEVARAALLSDEPVEELQRLATHDGAAGFRLVALPLGPAQGLANAVLCTLVPSPTAPRFGKRRAWL